MSLSHFQPRPQIYLQKLLSEPSNQVDMERAELSQAKAGLKSPTSSSSALPLQQGQSSPSNLENNNGAETPIAGWVGNEQSTSELARRAQEGVRRGVLMSDAETADSGESLIPPRILVAGAAGWGKSTLINNMFGNILTTASAGGTPVTSDFREFGPLPNAPVRLVDSRGLERHDHTRQLQTILRFVRARARMPLPDRVHAAWLVVGERWQQADAQLLHLLRNFVPVVVVVSKCDLPERTEIDSRSGLPAMVALKDEISRQFDDVDIVFCADPRKRTRDWEPLTCPEGHSKDYFTVNNRTRTWRCEFSVNERDGMCGQSGHADDRLVGYANLSRVTLWKLPVELMPAFVHAQRANCALKDARAVAIIRSGVLTMTGIAATPIPFPDLPLLLAAEGYMATRLFLLYNVPADFANVALFSSVNAAVIGSMGMAAKIIAKVLKTSGAGLPVGVAIDVIVATAVGTIVGVAIARVSSKWMLLTTDERQDDVESFRLMLLDAVRGIGVMSLANAIVRIIVFNDDRALTNMIQTDVNVNPTSSARSSDSHHAG